jgi:Spy/CpxP family protein refolding chaperone
MSKRFLSLAAAPILSLGLMAGAAIAQDQPGPPPEGRGRGMMMDPDQQVQRLAKQLNLTDDQKGQVKAILVDNMKQMQAMRQDSSIAPEDRRAKGMAMREDANAKIKALLTDDQKVQFDKIQAEQRQRFQQRQNPPVSQ